MKTIYIVWAMGLIFNTACAFSQGPSRNLASSGKAGGPNILTPEKMECNIRQNLVSTDVNGERIDSTGNPLNFTMSRTATATATFYKGSTSLADGSNLQGSIEIPSQTSQKTILFTWLRDSTVISTFSSITRDEKEVSASIQMFEPSIASAATKLNTLHPGEFDPILIDFLEGKYFGPNAKAVLAGFAVFCK